ncbi:tetratricopeptide repeat protein 36 [Nasonia vitripennis]|uniref:Tetratricopeptide repeat protein 36 n=1 Tax=Nasonia vitripennis TaxID=7425 RepID=A0A7M7GA56_NASVI|nr:tetratricopeptide repeat protein 36 [Nasonia vitripennis]
MNKLSEHDKVILDTIFDPLQPLGIDSNPGRIFNEPIEAEDDPELNEEVKEILKRAIVFSENGKFDEAFELFEKARVKAPRSASVLNDRAQALRLAGKSNEALADLNLAVEYSGGRGKAGVQALCQRAALYRFLEKDDEAREDFAKAAEQGSGFAKSQLVAMNPYAAMCNAMLHKITMEACKK